MEKHKCKRCGSDNTYVTNKGFNWVSEIIGFIVFAPLAFIGFIGKEEPIIVCLNCKFKSKLKEDLDASNSYIKKLVKEGEKAKKDKFWKNITALVLVIIVILYISIYL